MPHDRRVSNVMTGARARFTVGGRTLGWAFGVSWSEEIPMEAVEVLDKFEPYEYAPTAYRVALTARFFRIPGHSLRNEGIFPQGGRDSNALRTSILNKAEMEAQVADPHTGINIAKFLRVKTSGRNVDIGPRGLVGENVTFVAIYHFDEGDAAV